MGGSRLITAPFMLISDHSFSWPVSLLKLRRQRESFAMAAALNSIRHHPRSLYAAGFATRARNVVSSSAAESFACQDMRGHLAR